MSTAKPRYDLAVAQAAVRIVISDGCARKADADFQCGDFTKTRKAIEKMFWSLQPRDFAHVQTMGSVGGVRYGDVYGKVAKSILWFIKLSFDESSGTTVMSCHEAEHDLELADGRTLRRPRVL